MARKMAKKLAFMTYGHLLAEFGHPTVQGFVDRVPAAYQAADNSPGFIDRSKRNLEDYTHSWGDPIAPKCWGEQSLARVAATLSLWEDIESVTAYAYYGPHSEALKHRNNWFVHPGLPEHVAWWTTDDSIDWQTAADRMDQLFESGPAPQAFSIAKPFDEEGSPYKLDTVKVKAKAAVNSRKDI